MEEETKKVDETYFFDVSDEMLEYLTQEGIKAVERQEASFHALRERCYRLLNLLITGVGGAILLLFHSAKIDWAFFGLTSFSIGGTVIVVYLAFRCLFASRRPVAWASPLRLYVKDENGKADTLPILSRRKLYAYSYAFEAISEENFRIGDCFNRALKVSAFLPVASLVLGCLFFVF